LHADGERPADAAIRALRWDYPVDGKGEPDAEAVLREINGYSWPGREQVASFNDLKNDGSSSARNRVARAATAASGIASMASTGTVSARWAGSR
jgi:hypothetical protein